MRPLKKGMAMLGSPYCLKGSALKFLEHGETVLDIGMAQKTLQLFSVLFTMNGSTCLFCEMQNVP